MARRSRRPRGLGAWAGPRAGRCALHESRPRAGARAARGVPRPARREPRPKAGCGRAGRAHGDRARGSAVRRLRRRRAEARTRGRRHRRSLRTARQRGRDRDARRQLGAPEGVPQLPLGLLRRVEEPLGPLVLDVPLRQPAEDEGVPAQAAISPSRLATWTCSTGSATVSGTPSAWRGRSAGR